MICVPTSHCVGRGFGYIRYESGDFVLSVCSVNGREHNIQQALIMCRRKAEVL